MYMCVCVLWVCVCVVKYVHVPICTTPSTLTVAAQAPLGATQF